jgi:CubicO group peptidase (beta-lactamase class C family)
VAWAWRPTVGAALARTLGITNAMRIHPFARLSTALVICMSHFPAPVAAQMPSSAAGATAPDSWLFVSEGPSWWYRTLPSPTPTPLRTESPTPAEQPLVDRARALAATQPVRAVALLDGDRVVYKQFNAPASEDSTVFGFSMGKTVTAMAVGQAICKGKITLDTRAGEVLPSLVGKDLGSARVRDLLKMASGVFEGNSDSTIMTTEQSRAWSKGELNLADLIAEDRISVAQRGIFSNYKPGEAFVYKSTDPIVLGLMVSKATGMPWSQWVQESILNPMGAAHAGLYIQDRQQNGLADSGLRIKFDDWLRFAVWVKRQSREAGCFGKFVRDAFSTQIRNSGTVETRRTGKLFAGYGYFVWTDNEIAKNSALASGWGGQRISWSTEDRNDRMIVVISSVESWMPELYSLVRDWNRIPSQAR